MDLAIHWQYICQITIGGAETGSNPTDRSKLGTKRHILTDKEGIPISVVISSANTHDIKLVTEVVDSAVIRRRPSSYKTKPEKRRKLQHLCLDKAYNSEPDEQELIKRGSAYSTQKKKRWWDQAETQQILNRKKYSARRWVVERTNSWHNRFRKLFTRYEKNAENYLGLVQFSCFIIIYRRIILG